MVDTKLILLGGGGHCRSCIEVVQSTKQFAISGIIDKDHWVDHLMGIPIIGGDDKIPEMIEKNNYQFMVTLGQIKSSTGRRRLYNYIHEHKGQTPVIIASTGFVSK